LGISDADPGANDRTRSRTDAGAASAAYRTAKSCPKSGAEKCAAECLRVSLVALRGYLRVGVLPACLVVIIRLRNGAGARRERRQDRADKPCGDEPHRNILFLGVTASSPRAVAKGRPRERSTVKL
jgi:hypothetical protein